MSDDAGPGAGPPPPTPIPTPPIPIPAPRPAPAPTPPPIPVPPIPPTNPVEVIGAFSALCGPVAAIVTIFDLDTGQKVLWTVLVTLSAAVVAVLWFAWKRNPRRLLAVSLIIAVLVNFGVAAGAALSWRLAVEKGTLACIAPGERGGLYIAAFREAYARKGGRDTFGCGTSIVAPMLGGMHQNFTGPDDSPGVIFAIEPGAAVALDADDWAGYHSIRGPVETTAQAGFPYAESVRLKTGKKLEIGAGSGNWPRTAVVRRDGGSWFWVQAGMWPCYNSRFGGPEGSLGYPTGSQEYDDGRQVAVQRFEHGELYFDPERGAMTLAEFDRGESFDCAEEGAGPVPEDLYLVESTGGVAHEVVPDGHIDQDFVATGAVLDDLAVVVGLDPRSDNGGPHGLTFELLAAGETVLRGTAPLVNNGWTSIPGRSTPLTAGAVYTLRVSNASDDVLGFYLNGEDSAGSVGNAGCRAHVVGEKPEPEPHFAEACLAAHVRGH